MSTVDNATDDPGPVDILVVRYELPSQADASRARRKVQDPDFYFSHPFYLDYYAVGSLLEAGPADRETLIVYYSRERKRPGY